jgi:hypothetical protein
MAMPVGSMIDKFRPEFEEHIERAREQAGLGVSLPQVEPEEGGPYPAAGVAA